MAHHHAEDKFMAQSGRLYTPFYRKPSHAAIVPTGGVLLD